LIIGGLNVRLLPADKGACGFYRIREPHRVTENIIGWDIKIGFNFYTDKDADVVVMQRPMHRQIIEQHIPALQAAGKAVVVEIDDDFGALPFNNLAFITTHPKRDPNMNAHWLSRACKLADLVTCTTPALARRYAAHGRYAVIPNYVPARYLEIPHTGDGNTIGWAGNLHYHPHDLGACGRAVLHVLDSEPGTRFLGIGDERIATALAIPDDTAIHQPFVPLEEYPRMLAKLDVGIVPLEDTAFNQAKSCLKMLEYAACGAYPVVTPTPDNLRLHNTYGLGSTARKPKEWQRVIARTLHDKDAMHAAAQQARTVIAEHLTYERNSQQWLDAWRQAQANRYATQHSAHTPANV
jgi:glycosyltransferase involved in cell wall biosynthesis